MKMVKVPGGGGGRRLSRWSDLPANVLVLIADRLDQKIGILRLRSICRSWRSSLSLLPPSINFPLKLPTHLSLTQQTVYLLSPPTNPSNGGLLVKVEERENALNTFSLLIPLLSYAKTPQPKSPLNLLDYRITLVCESYVVYSDLEWEQVRIKKAVVSTNFFENGVFVVLGLKFSGGLLIWRFGDEGWTEIPFNGRVFSDVISYHGKFYASSNNRGRLVMIDSSLKPVELAPRLCFGKGICTHLVECDGNLYLVDRDGENRELRFRVFKLDDKGVYALVVSRSTLRIKLSLIGRLQVGSIGLHLNIFVDLGCALLSLCGEEILACNFFEICVGGLRLGCSFCLFFPIYSNS